MLQCQPGALGPASHIEATIPGLSVQSRQLDTLPGTDKLGLDSPVLYSGCGQLQYAIVELQRPIRLGLLQPSSQTEIHLQLASTLGHSRAQRREHLQINIGRLEL